MLAVNVGVAVNMAHYTALLTKLTHSVNSDISIPQKMMLSPQITYSPLFFYKPQMLISIYDNIGKQNQ